MIKNIKAKNEQIIREHFEEVFGDGYTIEVKWGFPVTTVISTLEKDGVKSSWKITFDMETEFFELATFSTKTVDEKIVADWAIIDKRIIDFVIKRTSEISENLFYTREIPIQPVPVIKDVAPLEESEDEKDLIEDKEVIIEQN
jgi:hypothetical protein